jgi:hypothetical protein
MDRLKFNETNYMREKTSIYLIDGDGAQKIFIYFLFWILSIGNTYS